MQAANAPFRAMHSGGILRHIWLKKRPASRKSVMPHSGRILCRDVIPSAVRSGGPRRAYRTRTLRMRHEIIFRSRTGLWLSGRSDTLDAREHSRLRSRYTGYLTAICRWRGEPVPPRAVRPACHLVDDEGSERPSVGGASGVPIRE